MRGAGVLLAATLLAPPAAGQPKDARPGLDERAELLRLVDAAAQGKPGGGDAWLKFAPHFLLGPDGRTYVPFTLTFDEAPDAFRTAAIYIRVAPRGDEGRAGKKATGVQNILGVASGELPISAPDRRQGAGAPTAAEATVMLRSLAANPASGAYPFEDLFVAPTTRDGASARVRRAMVVAPGDYDLYVATLDRGGRGGRRKWALMKQQLTVPAFSTTELSLSTPIVADTLAPLQAPLPPAEQRTRPYSFGAAELTPAMDVEFDSSETLHVAFQVYGARPDHAGKPDIRIEYRLYRLGFAGAQLLGATPPQQLDPATLPKEFDLRKGEQLTTVQSLPLDTYTAGGYRLDIRVIDNHARTAVERNVPFSIR